MNVFYNAGTAHEEARRVQLDLHQQRPTAAAGSVTANPATHLHPARSTRPPATRLHRAAEARIDLGPHAAQQPAAALHPPVEPRRGPDRLPGAGPGPRRLPATFAGSAPLVEQTLTADIATELRNQARGRRPEGGTVTAYRIGNAVTVSGPAGTAVPTPCRPARARRGRRLGLRRALRRRAVGLPDAGRLRAHARAARTPRVRERRTGAAARTRQRRPPGAAGRPRGAGAASPPARLRTARTRPWRCRPRQARGVHRSMRVTLLTEGTYPHSHGGVSVWCDQLVRGMPDVDFRVVAVTGTGREPLGLGTARERHGVDAVPLWGAAPAGRGRRRPAPGGFRSPPWEQLPAPRCCRPTAAPRSGSAPRCTSWPSARERGTLSAALPARPRSRALDRAVARPLVRTWRARPTLHDALTGDRPAGTRAAPAGRAGRRRGVAHAVSGGSPPCPGLAAHGRTGRRCCSPSTASTCASATSATARRPTAGR